MPTPVGPVPRDPDDPDLWDEWYQGDNDDDEMAESRFSWTLRLTALLVALAFALLLVFSR